MIYVLISVSVKKVLSELEKKHNMFILAPILTLLVFLTHSQGKIWEVAKPLLNYTLRYQEVPPVNVTAVKFAKHFLMQGEVIDWQSAVRLKRQAGGGFKHSKSYPYDVLFMIDSSGSIKRKDFRTGIEALKGLVPRTRPDTAYASMTFSNNAKIDFLFCSPEEAKRKLELSKMRYDAGKTNTQAALQLARESVFNESANSGVRINSFKRKLIVTDGQSNVKKEKTLYNAFRLKEAGIEIFVIAVGKYMPGISEIVGLASSTDAHLYRVKNLKSFFDIVKLIPNWNVLREQQHRLWLNSMTREGQGY